MKTITKVSMVLLLVVPLLAACQRQEVEKPPNQVSVRLKWLHSAQFAGLYIAEQKGFYPEENIAVTLNSGGPEPDELELVATGQDDFGIIAAPEAIVARREGVPVIGLAAIYRLNPGVFFALKESGIEEPEDFVGRRVLVYPTSFTLPAMLAKRGIDMNQIEVVSPPRDIEAFFAGEVEVWTGYLTNEVITVREQGYEINVIYPDDYGVHAYSDCIIASEEMVEDNPDLVERFLRATLRGWHYAIENPDEAAAMTLKYDETLDQAHERAVVEASIPLIQTGEDVIGWMRAEVWEGMHQMLLQQGLLDAPVDLDQVYTMEFLQKVYEEE